MLQNHLLQLLCLVAMEPPASLGAADLRDRKAEVLRAVRPPVGEKIRLRTVRARYTAGTVEGRDLPAYADEEGVDASRGTETFAEIVLSVDNPRWLGVPFVLRTGKALARDRREIVLHLRPAPIFTFGQRGKPRANTLRLGMDPDHLSLGFDLNRPGEPFELDHAELDAPLAPAEVGPYARLLLDILKRETTLSIRDDEAEESWRIVAPILDGWRRDLVPLHEYPAGSDAGDLTALRPRR